MGGIGLLAAPEPVVSKVAGVVAIAHGFDTLVAGWNQVAEGEHQQTFTEVGITERLADAGWDRKSAEAAGSVGDMVIGSIGSLGLGTVIGSLKVAAGLAKAAETTNRAAGAARVTAGAVGLFALKQGIKGTVNGTYQAYATQVRGRLRVDRPGGPPVPPSDAELLISAAGGFATGALDLGWSTTASALGGFAGGELGYALGGADGQRWGLEIGDALGGLGAAFHGGFVGKEGKSSAWKPAFKSAGFDALTGGVGVAGVWAAGGDYESMLAAWNAGRSVGNLATTLSPHLQHALLQACFCAGTPLEVPGGSKNVEEIRAGEKVLSRHEFDAEGRVEAKVVEEVFTRLGRVWHLGVEGRTIRTTGEHPFFERVKGWVACELLEEGDWLKTRDGRWVRVEKVEDTGTVEVVYNLRVADFHTYFVGCPEWGFSVWAHNDYRLVGPRITEEGATTAIIGDGDLSLARGIIRRANQDSVALDGHRLILVSDFDPSIEVFDANNREHVQRLRTDPNFPLRGKNVEALLEAGVTNIRFDVDATALHSNDHVPMVDNFIWSHPYAHGFDHLPVYSHSVIEANTALIRGFLESARAKLNPGGHIFIAVNAGTTLFGSGSRKVSASGSARQGNLHKWDVIGSAESLGYEVLVRRSLFEADDPNNGGYPDYRPMRNTRAEPVQKKQQEMAVFRWAGGTSDSE